MNFHNQLHTRLPGKPFCYKCTIPSCHSSFDSDGRLNKHMRIHNNDLDECAYCPYRYAKPYQYEQHLKSHFKIREFQCDQCDLKFSSRGYLNRHYQKHEGLIYYCLICNTYEAATKDSADHHLRRKHADIVGSNFQWDDVRHHIKIK